MPNGQARRCSRDCQQSAFGEDLTNYAPSSCAQGHANCDFPVASHPARQQKVCAVAACNHKEAPRPSSVFGRVARISCASESPRDAGVSSTRAKDSRRSTSGNSEVFSTSCSSGSRPACARAIDTPGFQACQDCYAMRLPIILRRQVLWLRAVCKNLAILPPRRQRIPAARLRPLCRNVSVRILSGLHPPDPRRKRSCRSRPGQNQRRRLREIKADHCWRRPVLCPRHRTRDPQRSVLRARRNNSPRPVHLSALIVRPLYVIS